MDRSCEECGVGCMGCGDVEQVLAVNSCVVNFVTGMLTTSGYRSGEVAYLGCLCARVGPEGLKGWIGDVGECGVGA